MSEDLEKLITITLKIEGFSLAFSEDSGEIDPKELLTYIKKLHIPNIKIEAVKKAYGESKGKPYLFAPGLIESQAAAAPAAHFRPTRWLRPPLSPNTPLSMAKTVLIVDSSDNMIKVFKSAFSKAKVKVLFANQPDVFIKMMSSERPDLILLAAKMGKKDSGQLSARIRTSPKHVHVPVIMYSGSRPRQEIIRLFDTGITDYLVMPVNMNSYQSKIQNVLAQVRKTISSGSQVMLKPMAKAPAAATAKPTAKKGEAIEIEAVAPEEQTIQIRDLLKKVTSILAMPHILERVMKISGDSTSGAKELAQAVESDTATVSVVLKKANSAYFGKGEPIKSVQEAIVRIGLNEIKTLVLGLSVVKNFSKEQKSNGFDRMDFWKHSLATAILSKIFAEQVKYNPAEEMFLAGLIHDLGKIILDEHANPPYADIVMNAISNRSPLYNAERETLNFTHVDVGKAIVTHWKFPDSLISAVARHHTPEARQKEKSKPQELLQARLVYIANLLSKALGVGSGGDMSIHELPLSSWVKTFQHVTFDSDTLTRFHKELTEVAEFLDLGADIAGSGLESGEGLPEVVLIDPLMDVRLLNVTKIHLEATGFQVQTLLKESELQKPAADKRTAVCVLLDSYDKIDASWKKIQEKISNDSPYVFIVPATEKRLQEKLKLPERPEFFVDNQTLLYEPFDVSELHNALQIQSG